MERCRPSRKHALLAKKSVSAQLSRGERQQALLSLSVEMVNLPSRLKQSVLCLTNESDPFIFAEDCYIKFLCFGQFGAGCRARHKVIGFL